MKYFSIVFAFCCYCLGVIAQTQQLPLIPYPSKVEKGVGNYDVLQHPSFYYSNEVKNTAFPIINRVVEELETATGKSFSQNVVKVVQDKGINIFLNNALPAEGYVLKVEPTRVSIEAKDKNGVFYALQTFKQLLPRAAMAGVYVKDANWQAPAVVVEDAPRFGWRGFMLDEGRHFFGKEEVKRVLDIMATYKLNRFHWHLTEDQGWRVEIKKYPKLTTTGAARKWTVQWKNGVEGEPDYTPYGPYYYTQDDLKEIVAYAKDRCIEIIPEIDMPGHIQSALAAYPEFSCTPNEKHEVWPRFGVSTDVLNVANPKAVQFAKDVLDELIEIFPFKYIHIGGDECPTNAWKNNEECKKLLKSLNSTNYHDLQTHFYRQINKHLSEKKDINKRREIVAWNETLNGSTDSLNVTIMAWVGADRAAKTAAERGLDVILSPQIPYYINRKQSTLPTEPPTQGHGTETVKAVYNYVPANNIPENLMKYYKGVQANFWTEHVPTGYLVEYLMLPRLAAVAEAGWTPQNLRNYKQFVERIRQDTTLYNLRGWDYGKHIMQDEKPTLPTASTRENPIWYRLVSVSTDKARTGKCIELIRSNSPLLQQYAGSKVGQLWSNTIAKDNDPSDPYQWWAFVESPTQKGHYALINKAKPKGSLRSTATNTTTAGRWEYDDNTMHYDFILGEEFENGKQPSFSIRSVKHNGVFLNLAAAKQNYAINLWNNPGDMKGGLWQPVPYLYNEQMQVQKALAFAFKLLYRPTYTAIEKAIIGSYSAESLQHLQNVVNDITSKPLPAELYKLNEILQTIHQAIQTAENSLGIPKKGDEITFQSIKYPTYTLQIAKEVPQILLADSLKNIWIVESVVPVKNKKNYWLARFRHKASSLGINPSSLPMKAAKTPPYLYLSFNTELGTWQLSKDTTELKICAISPKAWENAGTLLQSKSPILGSEWFIKQLPVTTHITHTNLQNTYTIVDRKVIPLQKQQLSITDLKGVRFPVNQKLPIGIYLINNGKETHKTYIK